MKQDFKGLDQRVSVSKLKMYAINKILMGICYKHGGFAVGLQEFNGQGVENYYQDSWLL